MEPVSHQTHLWQVCIQNINTKQLNKAVLYSVTSMMSGQVYSEWRIPSEWEGEDLKVTEHFSGLCAPGPGFLVVSGVRSVRRGCGRADDRQKYAGMWSTHFFLPIVVYLPHATLE